MPPTLKSISSKLSAEMGMTLMYDIIIIGGGAAGLTAALYSLRAGKSVLVLERESFGGQITASPRVENYPGIPAVSGSAFADALLEQVLSLGGEIELEEVKAVTADGKYKAVQAGNKSYVCKGLIIATGVRHRRLGAPGEDVLAGNGVSYCAVCDGAFFKDKEVAVVGGGDTALQSALFLSAVCSRVHLVHRRTAFRAEAALVRRVEAAENVRLLTPYTVRRLCGTTELEGIELTPADGGETLSLPVEGLFVAVGQLPDNELFSGLVRLDEAGYVAAGEDCCTSAPGIFAAGDCRTKRVRQLTTAAADGAVAALAACGYADGLEL